MPFVDPDAQGSSSGFIDPDDPKGPKYPTRSQAEQMTHHTSSGQTNMIGRAVEDMSTSERAVAGAGNAFVDIGRGVRTMLPMSMGGMSAQELDEARRLDKPLMKTPAAQIGNIGGNMAIAAPATFIPGANTVLGAAAIGGGFGALQPARDWQERAGNVAKSALLSGGVTGLVKAAPAMYRALIDPFTQAGQQRIAMSALQRFAKDPTTLTSLPGGPKELIPGSKATLAEVTGDPGIAQLQRAAAAKSPDIANIMAESKTARLAARQSALSNIAGSHDEREFMDAWRNYTANAMYEKAWAKPIDPKTAQTLAPEVQKVLAKPSIQRAIGEAKELAQEEGETITNSGSLKGLHYAKKAMDAQISKAKGAGDDNLVRLLKGSQDDLTGLMDKLSPEYRQAREAYANVSKPINQYKIGQYMYDKLVPALTDLGAERITPAAFAKALKEGDEMAAKATGFKGAKLKDVLKPEDMSTLINLAKDVGREAGAIERGKVPGSPTAQYFVGGNVLRQVLGPLGLPQSWAESGAADVLANRWVSLAGKPIEEKVQSQLGQMLADPSKVSDAIAASQARGSAMRQAMIPLSAAGRAALPPAAIGAGASAAGQ